MPEKKPTKKSSKNADSESKEAPKKGGHAPEQSSVHGKQKKILIVEDERPLAHALELKFKHEGYDVTVATDGSEALSEARSGKFAVILLDLIMPKMDGFTFLESMKKKGAKSKVIILSNLGQEEDRERAESLGAIGYYVKSNTPITEIVKKVKSVL